MQYDDYVYCPLIITLVFRETNWTLTITWNCGLDFLAFELRNDSSQPYSYLDCFSESYILYFSGGQTHYRLKVRLPANRISIESENATSLRSSFVQINCIIIINKPSIVYTTSFSFRSFINETNILNPSTLQLANRRKLTKTPANKIRRLTTYMRERSLDED